MQHLAAVLSAPTVRQIGNRLANIIGAVYEGIVAARRRVPVACIRVNVIAIRCKLANITGPSSDRCGGVIQLGYASYANPGEFRISEISQRGCAAYQDPSRMGACPLPKLAQSNKAHGERQE